MKTQYIQVQGYYIPEPLSRPLNFFYTYNDACKALVEVAQLYWDVEGVHPRELDWKTLRNASGDTMSTIIGILKNKKETK